MSSRPHATSQAAAYRIRVVGRLDRLWTNSFPGFRIRTGKTPEGTMETRLTGNVPDQSALRGILCRLWDLGLTVSGVERLAEGHAERSIGDDQ